MNEMIDEIPIVKIQGQRVVLQALDVNDAGTIYSAIQESLNHLSRHLPWPADCKSEEDVAARIDSWEIQSQMGSGGCWGIFVPCDGKMQFAGCIILGWIQWAHLSASISYWLIESFTGNGYATEALNLLCRYCFDHLHLNRLELSTSVCNKPSAAVAERCCFKQEGLSREFERINGKFEDHIRYARLASD